MLLWLLFHMCLKDDGFRGKYANMQECISNGRSTCEPSPTMNLVVVVVVAVVVVAHMLARWWLQSECHWKEFVRLQSCLHPTEVGMDLKLKEHLWIISYYESCCSWGCFLHMSLQDNVFRGNIIGGNLYRHKAAVSRLKQEWISNLRITCEPSQTMNHVVVVIVVVHVLAQW